MNDNGENIRRLRGVPAPTKKAVTSDWVKRHRAALSHPSNLFEIALVEMLRGWLTYADAVEHRYGSRIGDDGVLGEHWAQIGVGLRGLLNGELGRLDGGTLDSILCTSLRKQNCNPDKL